LNPAGLLTVTVNGRPRQLRTGSSVADLLAELGLGHKWVLVELNGEPLARSGLEGVTLSPGDRVELVRAVAGG